MKIETLKKYSKKDLLKYLAFLQVCPSNSCHLQTLQDIQNGVLKGIDVLSDESLWSELEDFQTGLFVENFICYSACQFRAFVADATDKPWQLSAWVDALVKYKMISRQVLYSVFFFLCLSDKIADKLGMSYYEIGDNTNEDAIRLVDPDSKMMQCLDYSIDELNEVAHHKIVDFSFLDDYCCKEGDDVGVKPLLKDSESFFVLSPNALMNCAWRELLRILKTKFRDAELGEMFHALMAEEIHNSLTGYWPTNTALRMHEGTCFSSVYQVFYNRYFVVTVVGQKPQIISLDAINTSECLDVSMHLAAMDKKLREYDKEAETVHIVVPVTMQNELTVVSNTSSPIIMIQWQPLKDLLRKDDDNPLWLFHYAIDRKNSEVLFPPGTNEEDVIALYLKYKHSFYISDNVSGRQGVCLMPGFSLPLIFGIKKKANRHAVKDGIFNLLVKADQDSPDGIPFYEAKTEDNDLMIGEYLQSNIFLKLPKNTKDVYPELHGVGRSLLLWYYALEKYSGKPVLMKNLRLTIERDENLKEGFRIENNDYASVLKISPNLLGNDDGRSIEKHLLEAVVMNANCKSFALNHSYASLINKVFESSQGGIIQRLPEYDLLGDTTIGERSHYVVDGRRKSLVIGELAEKFNVFPIGKLSVVDSKSLVDGMIHYLNKRIVDILEQYDLEQFLVSMMKLRDGIIFWNRTMSERYNYMISFYRFLGSEDPVQEKRIHEFVETDLCTRCLIEYSILKCTKHGDKPFGRDIDNVEELFALMSELINIGYLADYYKSDSFTEVIEVLQNGRFAYPIDEDKGLSRYAKEITLDRLENPILHAELRAVVKEPDSSEYESIFTGVFSSEFGVDYEQFKAITSYIIEMMQDAMADTWAEEVEAFTDRVSKAVNVSSAIVSLYIIAFGISSEYHDLSKYSIFKEHDTYPCRYKRKLGLINRPICIIESGNRNKVIFSYRGFVQLQFNLLENIGHSNYSGISDLMRSYIGSINNKRGKNFEAGVYNFFGNQKTLLRYRSAKIGPKDMLKNVNGALGDIDVLLIDNEAQKILLIEAKNYNECKTPYEAVECEKKMMDDMKKVMKRDKWARSNKKLFESYAKQASDKYQVASVVLTYNLSPLKIINWDYPTEIPVVWMKDIIENPMRIFDYGEYS